MNPCDCCGAPAEIEIGDCCDDCCDEFRALDVAEILKARKGKPGAKPNRVARSYGEPVCQFCREPVPHVVQECLRCDSGICECGHAYPPAYDKVLGHSDMQPAFLHGCVCLDCEGEDAEECAELRDNFNASWSETAATDLPKDALTSA